MKTVNVDFYFIIRSIFGLKSVNRHEQLFTFLAANPIKQVFWHTIIKMRLVMCKSNAIWCHQVRLKFKRRDELI